MMGVPSQPVPVATFVATDLAILGVPFRLWLYAMCAGLIVAIIVGIITGYGIEPLSGVLTCGSMMWFCRRAYMRDRHIVGVWQAKYLARVTGRELGPLQPGWKPRGILRNPRRLGS